MSRITKATSTPSTKPVCVHCRNLGLPSDHWLRSSTDANSQVVCPVLLNTECRYCHQFGHTVGRCPVILHEKTPNTTKKTGPNIGTNFGRNLDQRSTEQPSSKQPTLEKKKPIVNSGVFSAFDSDTDEDEEKEEPEEKEEFPALSVPEPTHCVNTDYIPMVVLTEEMRVEVAKSMEENYKLFTSGKSWADICYDLDEQEEEEMRRRNV